jgi:hypothetical protein
MLLEAGRPGEGRAGDKGQTGTTGKYDGHQRSKVLPSRVNFPDVKNGTFSAWSPREVRELNPGLPEGRFFLFTDSVRWWKSFME